MVACDTRPHAIHQNKHSQHQSVHCIVQKLHLGGIESNYQEASHLDSCCTLVLWSPVRPEGRVKGLGKDGQPTEVRQQLLFSACAHQPESFSASRTLRHPLQQSVRKASSHCSSILTRQTCFANVNTW